MTVGATRPAPRIGRLARWKLLEPVLLYVGAAQLLAGVAVLVSGLWHGGPVAQFAVAAVALFWMLTAAGAWAARSTVYSPAGAVGAVRNALDQR